MADDVRALLAVQADLRDPKAAHARRMATFHAKIAPFVWEFVQAAGELGVPFDSEGHAGYERAGRTWTKLVVTPPNYITDETESSIGLAIGADGAFDVDPDFPSGTLWHFIGEKNGVLMDFSPLMEQKIRHAFTLLLLRSTKLADSADPMTGG